MPHALALRDYSPSTYWAHLCPWFGGGWRLGTVIECRECGGEWFDSGGGI